MKRGKWRRRKKDGGFELNRRMEDGLEEWRMD